MSGWTYSFENVEKKSKMQKGKKGALLTVGWILEMGMTKLGAADLMDTSALPPAASEAGFWTFWTNDSVPFQDLLLLFKLCSLFCTITTGHWAPEAAVHRHHRLQVQHGAEAKSHQGCDSVSAILRQNQLRPLTGIAFTSVFFSKLLSKLY